MNCKVMEIPFSFLSIPMRANPKREVTCQPMISKVKAKLATWRGKHLSFGGKICLIKFALSSLPLYFLSFFKVPK